MRAAKTKVLDDRRWEAVTARDRKADGTFYYSVATTGVYCRPSCAARRPLRGNVRFHATCEDAEAAGFRACKRCKPNAVEIEGASAKIAAACRLIERADAAPSLGELARHAGLSPHHFHRLFKSVTGMTPRAYAVAERGRRMQQALRNGASVTEAIYDAGFSSSGRFYAAAREALGMRPDEFRKGGASVLIDYAIAPCSLGQVLVAATPAGVCAVLLGDNAAPLEQSLHERFPRASLREQQASLGALVKEVVACIEMPARSFDLPLDIQGTAFQAQVWAALRQIPPGETATYAQIARRIGRPKAVRAVGAACGANPVAVIVPCHRVVGSDGALTGYRWGTGRKKELLRREKP
jgi:AraC family transcriptional regulator of adaptative response/methylated-DNA-[protein]-cysteine methyltransferase